MGVFFNPLFKKMSEEKIKQFELQKYCQISSLTFAKMRRGECVTLETLIKICEYLECDFGDIMIQSISHGIFSRLCACSAQH